MKFNEKLVYYYWQVISHKQWQLADDPVESAEIFLKTKGEEEGVVHMEIKPKPGTEVVRYYMKDFIERWAVRTQEPATDSTCTWLIILTILELTRAT